MINRYEVREVEGIPCVFDNLVERYAPMGMSATAFEFADKLNNGEVEAFSIFWVTVYNGQLLL